MNIDEYRRQSWSEIKDWHTAKELAHAMDAWQVHLWWKGCKAFCWALVIQAPFIAVWMLAR
jgi:hypothetical protein